MDSTIIVAGIGAFGLIVSSLVGVRRTERAVKEVQQQVSNVHVSIGNPNGKGNVTQMLENLIEWKGAHMAEHEKLESKCPLFDHERQ